MSNNANENNQDKRAWRMFTACLPENLTLDQPRVRSM
jgi:hypothetical protein